MKITYTKSIMPLLRYQGNTNGCENLINELITINLINDGQIIGVYNTHVLVKPGIERDGIVLGNYINLNKNINVAHSTVFVRKTKWDLAVLNVINVYERGRGLLNDKLNTTIVEKTEIV